MVKRFAAKVGITLTLTQKARVQSLLVGSLAGKFKRAPGASTPFKNVAGEAGTMFVIGAPEGILSVKSVLNLYHARREAPVDVPTQYVSGKHTSQFPDIPTKNPAEHPHVPSLALTSLYVGPKQTHSDDATAPAASVVR